MQKTKEKVKQLIDRQQLFVGEENRRIQFAFAYILGEDPRIAYQKVGS